MSSFCGEKNICFDAASPGNFPGFVDPFDPQNRKIQVETLIAVSPTRGLENLPKVSWNLKKKGSKWMKTLEDDQRWSKAIQDSWKFLKLSMVNVWGSNGDLWELWASACFHAGVLKVRIWNAKPYKNALINAVGNVIGLDVCPCSFRGVSALGQQIPVIVMPKNFPPAPTIASDNTILNLSVSIPQDRMKPWLGTHSLLRKMKSWIHIVIGLQDAAKRRVEPAYRWMPSQDWCNWQAPGLNVGGRPLWSSLPLPPKSFPRTCPTPGHAN